MIDRLASHAAGNAPQIKYVPASWWQMIPFLRMNFELVRDIDPLAERILSNPWAPSSLLEYAYMSGTFLRSITHFITISGERAGVTWTYYRAGIGFILSVGILRQFRQAGMGMQTIGFIESYVKSRGGNALVAVMGRRNKPVRFLASAAGGHPLGLATTTLTLSGPPAPTLATRFEIGPINAKEAAQAWKRWRLHEVEQVAGASGAEVAARLLASYSWLEPLPRGMHLSLHQNGREIGCAHVRQHRKETRLYLFPSHTLWSGDDAADLIASLTCYLNSPITHLELTQTHADMLAVDAPFSFERLEDRDRLYSFKLLCDADIT